jgi:hypothetical protein
MFRSIARWLLRSKLSKASSDAPKNFLSWQQINSIGLIISKDTSLNRNALDKWIADTKKFVEVFYVETSEKIASYGDWYCFTKKDKTLFNLPKKTIEADLQQKKYDLLINTASDKDYYAAAVLIALNAPYKCAASPELQDANLIVSPSVEGNLIHQLQDTMRYLQMIRKV